LILGNTSDKSKLRNLRGKGMPHIGKERGRENVRKKITKDT